jgi:hypothetical protein
MRGKPHGTSGVIKLFRSKANVEANIMGIETALHHVYDYKQSVFIYPKHTQTRVEFTNEP